MTSKEEELRRRVREIHARNEREEQERTQAREEAFQNEIENKIQNLDERIKELLNRKPQGYEVSKLKQRLSYMKSTYEKRYLIIAAFIAFILFIGFPAVIFLFKMIGAALLSSMTMDGFNWVWAIISWVVFAAIVWLSEDDAGPFNYDGLSLFDAIDHKVLLRRIEKEEGVLLELSKALEAKNLKIKMLHEERSLVEQRVAAKGLPFYPEQKKLPHYRE